MDNYWDVVAWLRQVIRIYFKYEQYQIDERLHVPIKEIIEAKGYIVSVDKEEWIVQW